MSNITVNELAKIKDTAHIIDIRGTENYNNGHIDNAIHIPYNELLVNPEKSLKKDKVYYIYCQRGTRSVKICQILQLKGYKVINILGGYQAWILLK